MWKVYTVLLEWFAGGEFVTKVVTNSAMCRVLSDCSNALLQALILKPRWGFVTEWGEKKRPGMGVSFGVMIDEYLGATLIGGIAKKEAWWWLWMKKKRRKGYSGLLRICFNRYYLYHIIICSCCHSCTIRSSQSIVQSVLSRVTLLLHCLPPSLPVLFSGVHSVLHSNYSVGSL